MADASWTSALCQFNRSGEYTSSALSVWKSTQDKHRKWGDSEACLQGNRLFKLAKGLQHCVFQAWQQCSLSLLHGSGEKPMTAVSPLGMPVGNAMGIAGTLGRNAGLPPRPGTAAVPSVSSILGGL